MNGIVVDPYIFFALLLAVFCTGVGIFFRQCARHPWRRVAIGWVLGAVLVLGGAALVHAWGAGGRAALFTGLILPVWLLGGLLGAMLGLAWYRRF
ncbi:hypothetical protein D6850_07980 [Roseovarius spongiae]|uniref:Uncharacterized protein n=1 Tax=Roseovarius spongiae TaxID=2320272 RepID=A0A3A8B5I0_9RHOB|nr:hypothetical protein [Roseovarius spongiae]RKF14806.1 hypothetical protein D6850_07980 [Roseovarius spongiae]